MRLLMILALMITMSLLYGQTYAERFYVLINDNLNTSNLRKKLDDSDRPIQFYITFRTIEEDSADATLFIQTIEIDPGAEELTAKFNTRTVDKDLLPDHRTKNFAIPIVYGTEVLIDQWISSGKPTDVQIDEIIRRLGFEILDPFWLKFYGVIDH